MEHRATRYLPDALDRLTSVTFPGPKTVSYTYDDLPGGSAADYPGQRTKLTYPDGKYVEYTYDQGGRMKTVKDWLTNSTTYDYNDAGMLTKTTLPNGVWTDYAYDNADRLTSVANKKPGPTTISSFTYVLDAIGNRTQMTDLTGTHNYVYDVLYRLTQAAYPGGPTDNYTYDENGNRKTKNSTSYTYDAADQMTATGGVSYGYDANGNQTTRGGDTFAYDHENRLTQTVIGGGTASSTYNGDGLRMSHTVAGTPASYTWDINAALPVVLQDGTNTYVYGLDLISATDNAGVQSYFTYDGLGSTSEVTNSAGATVASYTYDVFGAIRSQTGTSGNYWLFTGEQRDTSEGLYYLRARYYDPATGRFIGKDPLSGASGAPQTQNRYAYALNSPVTLTDPSGLATAPCPVCEGLGIPGPTFSWPPPLTSVEAYLDWIHEVIDWLYNAFIPGLDSGVRAVADATYDAASTACYSIADAFVLPGDLDATQGGGSSGYSCANNVSSVYSWIDELLDFVYGEFLPWWSWVRDCNAEGVALAAGIGYTGGWTAGTGFVVVNYLATYLHGFELVHVLTMAGPWAMPAGGLVLVVVATHLALEACGQGGLF